jgi:hypothetical protein
VLGGRQEWATLSQKLVYATTVLLYTLQIPRCHELLLIALVCQSICRFKSDFTTLPLSLFKLKNRHWWNSGAGYHRIDYIIKVNIGAADISFELSHNDVKLSKGNAIRVEWQAAGSPSQDAHSVEANFSMSILPVATTPMKNVYEMHA